MVPALRDMEQVHTSGSPNDAVIAQSVKLAQKMGKIQGNGSNSTTKRRIEKLMSDRTFVWSTSTHTRKGATKKKKKFLTKFLCQKLVTARSGRAPYLVRDETPGIAAWGTNRRPWSAPTLKVSPS